MPQTICEACNDRRAVIVRPKNQQKLCKSCFIATFEQEIHETIISNALFQRGERVAIGASGGKDSTVLASVLKTLNERYKYGLDLVLLSIDEGIKGYRDDSLETVKRNSVQYDMPLVIIGYDQLYGWTMDQVVAQVGKKGNCTYCGVFRRQALDRGAAKLNINHVVTGHNADDVAETVMMNLLRGDLPRLARTTSIITSSPASDIKRSKPLKYTYEKEIVLYAHHKKLDYFSTECIYSPEAFRGSARALIKDLEKIRPSSILDIVKSGEDMAKLAPPELVSSPYCGQESGRPGDTSSCVDSKDHLTESKQDISARGRPFAPREIEITSKSGKEGLIPQMENEVSIHDKRPRKKNLKQTMGQCLRCGYISSQSICKACMLLEGLNRNRPRTTIEVLVDGEENGTKMLRQLADLELKSG